MCGLQQLKNLWSLVISLYVCPAGHTPKNWRPNKQEQLGKNPSNRKKALSRTRPMWVTLLLMGSRSQWKDACGWIKGGRRAQKQLKEENAFMRVLGSGDSSFCWWHIHTDLKLWWPTLVTVWQKKKAKPLHLSSVLCDKPTETIIHDASKAPLMGHVMALFCSRWLEEKNHLLWLEPILGST